MCKCQCCRAWPAGCPCAHRPKFLHGRMSRPLYQPRGPDIPLTNGSRTYREYVLPALGGIPAFCPPAIGNSALACIVESPRLHCRKPSPPQFLPDPAMEISRSPGYCDAARLPPGSDISWRECICGYMYCQRLKCCSVTVCDAPGPFMHPTAPFGPKHLK